MAFGEIGGRAACRLLFLAAWRWANNVGVKAGGGAGDGGRAPGAFGEGDGVVRVHDVEGRDVHALQRQGDVVAGDGVVVGELGGRGGGGARGGIGRKRRWSARGRR